MRRMHPDDEVLAALALDDPEVPESERRHVAACARCGTEVEELRQVRRLAATGPPDLGAERPGSQVWDAVLHQVSAGPESTTAGRGRRPAARQLAVALLAAACLVVGGVVGRWTAPPPEERPVTPVRVEVASAPLDTLTGGQRLGTATVARTGSRTDLVLSMRATDPEGGYLEVWLLHRDLQRMVSVGVVGDTGRPSFTIPRRLLERGYVVVDVSRQSFDGGPAHSGDSVMRGTLEATEGSGAR